MCLTLLRPHGLVYQVPLSMEFPRQEYWSGLPCPPPGDLPNLGIKTTSLTSAALAGGFFTTESSGKPYSSGSVQSLSHVRLIVTPWTAACQASLSITNSRSLLKLMSINSVRPSNHLILYRLHLLPPSIFLSIRVLFNESVLCIRWPKYWSFSFSISPSNEYSGLISFRIDWLDLLAVQGTLKSLLQHHSSKASIFRCSGFFFFFLIYFNWRLGFPGSSDGKVSAYNAGDTGSIPGSGRSPGEGNGMYKSRYKSFITYMIHKYFLPFLWVVFSLFFIVSFEA